MVEIVPVIQAREAPVEAGLVAMMIRAEFSYRSLTIRRHDRMQVWTKSRSHIMYQHRVTSINALDRQRTVS